MSKAYSSPEMCEEWNDVSLCNAWIAKCSRGNRRHGHQQNRGTMLGAGCMADSMLRLLPRPGNASHREPPGIGGGWVGRLDEVWGPQQENGTRRHVFRDERQSIISEKCEDGMRCLLQGMECGLVSYGKCTVASHKRRKRECPLHARVQATRLSMFSRETVMRGQM